MAQKKNHNLEPLSWTILATCCFCLTGVTTVFFHYSLPSSAAIIVGYLGSFRGAKVSLVDTGLNQKMATVTGLLACVHVALE